MRASAVYNLVYMEGDIYYHFPYVQPQGMYFIYYDNNVDVVSYIKVVYDCSGFLFTYPGEEDVSGGQNYDYLARKEVYNPAPNTIYSDAPYFDTDYALYLRSTAPAVGQAIVYDITINGRDYWGTVAID